MTTNITLQNFRYRGDYVATLPNGGPTTYAANDVVLYEGKLFVATQTIKGQTPDTSSLWIPFGNSRLSYRLSSPPDPQVGDTWLNTSTGKFYTFLEDEDSKQWVEL